jgi:radical SAM protein with 4Fe4S-binding SPASM domain
MTTNWKLRNVYLSITEKCDHSCKFCYASDGLGGFKDADIDTIKKIIDEVSKLKVENIFIVGGNPVLHSKITEILEYIKGHTDMRTILMTNTACFPNNSIEEMSKYIDCVAVTIHGQDSKSHDEICNVDGAYIDLIRNLELFQKENIAIEVAYNIAPYSFESIFTSIKSLIEKGLDLSRVLLQRIAPTSKTKLNEEYAVNAKQVNVALAQMSRIREELNIEIELVDPFPLCFVDNQFWNLITPCKCGVCDLAINGKGDVSRCPADPTYEMGNILETPINELWTNAKELCDFRTNAHLPEECKMCANKDTCRGGCVISCNMYNSLKRSHLDMFRRKVI